MISFGNILSDIKAFFIGTTSVSKVFYQGVKVWPSTESGYLIFRAQGSAPITVGLASRSSVQTTLEYSSDNGATWNNMTTADTFTVSTTGTTDVWVRGKQTGNQSDSNFTQFTTSGTGRMRLVGNINSLWSYNDITGENIRSYCAYRMFEGCANIRSLSNLTMPSTQLANSCYMRTFRDCTDLSAVPAGLLPATTLTTAVYRGLFYGCTSLTAGPELPATELGSYCYRDMFYGATALATAPELPATELASNCYDRMFRACTSLTSAPELPAPILATSCYDSMFRDCTSLNYIKCLATDISASNCTSNWVNNVAPTGTFVPDPSMNDWVVDSVNGIPIGWTVEDQTDLRNAIRLTSNGNSTVVLNRLDSGRVVEYSVNKGTTWSPMSVNDSVSLANGQSVLLRGYVTGSSNPVCRIGGTGDLTLDGYLIGMMDYVHSGSSAADRIEQCASMFSGNTAITDATNLKVPSQSNDGGYMNMFKGCTSLVYGPKELPAVNTSVSQYQSMFEGCTSLLRAPIIRATDGVNGDMTHMFKGCTSLTTAPTLRVTDGYQIYYGMFDGCTSLVTPPADVNMNVGTAYMFQRCTSLKKSPRMYDTIQNAEGMFNHCSNLKTVTCVSPSDVSGSYTSGWLAGVSSTGTFYKSEETYYKPSVISDPESTWSTGSSGIPSNWDVFDEGWSIASEGVKFQAVNGVTPCYALPVTARSLYGFDAELSPLSRGEGIISNKTKASNVGSTQEARLYVSPNNGTTFFKYGTNSSSITSGTFNPLNKRIRAILLVANDEYRLRLRELSSDGSSVLNTYTDSNYHNLVASDVVNNTMWLGGNEEFTFYSMNLTKVSGGTTSSVNIIPLKGPNGEIALYDQTNKVMLEELNGVDPVLNA